VILLPALDEIEVLREQLREFVDQTNVRQARSRAGQLPALQSQLLSHHHHFDGCFLTWMNTVPGSLR
jgi:hypothetical protein